MTDTERERKKEYLKICYYKRKNLLYHLINRVEELNNVCLNKQIFICYKSFRILKRKFMKGLLRTF